MTGSEHFDAVVVGSGFGGSVMAYRLAEAGMTVCVLERGKSYPPGSFPRSPRDMGRNFWDPDHGKLGLFQVWSFEHVDGLVSAGLGGGSLIYANVLIRKDEEWFVRRRRDGSYDPWPVTRRDLDPHYDNVESMLSPQPYPFGHPPYDSTPKTRAFRDAAERLIRDSGGRGVKGVVGKATDQPAPTWGLPNLAVTFGQPPGPPVPGEPIRDGKGGTDNLHGRIRTTCRLCGECDIGCNFGSKNTLDYNYLTEAKRLGAELRDRCEVRAIAPDPKGGYSVGYVAHHAQEHGGSSAGRSSAGGGRSAGGTVAAVEVHCDRLVLSAGTFGSTCLLLENRHNFPRLSDRLGHHFSGNGDFLGLVHHARERSGRRKGVRVLAPSHGPVITSTLRIPDTRDNGSGPGLYVQDGGYPGFVDWMVEVGDLPGTLSRVLRASREWIRAWFTHDRPADLDGRMERLIGDGHASASLLPLLGMGLDTPGGTMSLDAGGRLALDWSVDRSSEYFARVIDTMKAISSRMDARIQLDPLWYLRKVITVHPLGGCSMGHFHGDGVVDSFGEVFDYPGFVIADGSVMPGPVGPNPSLTIAALSDRFAEHQIRRFERRHLGRSAPGGSPEG